MKFFFINEMTPSTWNVLYFFILEFDSIFLIDYYMLELDIPWMIIMEEMIDSTKSAKDDQCKLAIPNALHLINIQFVQTNLWIVCSRMNKNGHFRCNIFLGIENVAVITGSPSSAKNSTDDRSSGAGIFHRIMHLNMNSTPILFVTLHSRFASFVCLTFTVPIETKTIFLWFWCLFI